MSKNGNSNNNQGSSVKIPEGVKRFTTLTLKKFKKENKYAYDGKKELVKGYYSELLFDLPCVVKFMLTHGHLADRNDQPKIKEIKSKVYSILVDEEFIKAANKYVKEFDDLDKNDLKYLRLLPIILGNIIREIDKENEKIVAEGRKDVFDTTDLIELSRRIQSVKKKTVKKFEKAGIPSKVMFEVLTVIPTKDALDSTVVGNTSRRVREFYNTIYELAKSQMVPFVEIAEIVIPDEAVSGFVLAALLEKRSRFSSFNDSQKQVWSLITNWAIKNLEEFDSETIERVLRQYVKTRKNDANQNRDAARRYAISSINETDYPHITKVVNKMKNDDQSVEKFFL